MNCYNSLKKFVFHVSIGSTNPTDHVPEKFGHVPLYMTESYSFQRPFILFHKHAKKHRYGWYSLHFHLSLNLYTPNSCDLSHIIVITYHISIPDTQYARLDAQSFFPNTH